MTTLSSYLAIARNASRWTTIAAKAPDVATQTRYFQDNIGKVTSAEELVNNSRLFTYAMKAFGLGDRAYAKGLMKQVLQQGVGSSTTLAYKLNDPNILAFAKVFDFARNGAQTTQSASLAKSVVDQYTQNALETGQSSQNAGVGLALYFQRKAPSIASVYGILADRKLLQVVQTALNIPAATAVMPIDSQAAMLTKRLDLSDFKDAAKLQNFIARFAAQYDARYGDASATGSVYSNAILLGASQDTGGGLGASLLQAMQAYRANT
ncbi:MAG TPA: DUF1217 domain-containing protein [Rhodoblastus sp.]|nr:DUF1217 domain-containing protein [Rhodoblastus sp.]